MTATLSTVAIPTPPGGTPRLTGVLGVPSSKDHGVGVRPGVVVVHEAFGVDDVMRRQVLRLADAGYTALMPDLFSAGGAKRCLVSTMKAMTSGQGRAFTDIEAARSALLSREDASGAVGVIGFCMGGAFALLTATRGFDAASANYGRLPDDLDATMSGACPVVASYGGADKSLKGAAQQLEESLTRVGVAHDVQEYPGAGHSFLNDAPNGPAPLRPLMKLVLGAGPDPLAAADAWARIDGFFAEHLGGPRP